MSLLIPHPPMYPYPSVSTLLPLVLSATQTPVLISPCMPASPRPLTPIKPHCVLFFRVGGFSWPFMICLYPSDWFTLTMTQSSHKFWLIADTIQASLFYSYLLNYTFSLYLNLTVLPFFPSCFLLIYPPHHHRQQNNDNETPLHCAAQYGHSQVVRLLLEELTDPTMRNNKFETPLDLAALYGRLEVVKLLLSAHPNLLSCNTKKHTPLHLASRNGHLPVVEVLLDAGMDINYEVCACVVFVFSDVYLLIYFFLLKNFCLQVFLNILSWPKSC